MDVDNTGTRQWHKRPQEGRSPAPATPLPAKRGKSEEKESDSGPIQQPKFENVEPEIRDIFDTLRDMQDDLKTQNNQISFLLFNQVEKQRADCATKILVKNFWKYTDTADPLLLQEHRETMVKWMATQAGIQEKQIDRFTFDHRKGRQLSPFSLVDTKDTSCRQAILDWQKQLKEKGINYIEEWPTTDSLKNLTSGQGNADGINGRLRIEPCIGAFDKLQSEPLKACMSAMASLLPQPFEFRHSWKHVTVQHKASDDYILWIALDHLYGNGKIYVNKALFKEREFEQAFRTSYQGILTRKSVGGKGKSKDGTETKMTPEGLLRAVGLTGDGKGSYLKGGHLSIKATAPFLFEIRAIESNEFSEKYQEHLNRIADRILRPTVTI
jgi:hypothetical protein